MVEDGDHTLALRILNGSGEQYDVCRRAIKVQKIATADCAENQATGSDDDTRTQFAHIEWPPDGETVTGSIEVSGWAIDAADIRGVEIILNDRIIGQANLGIRRPDVADAYPTFGSAGSSGFSFRAEARAIDDAEYTIALRILNGRNERIDACHRTIKVRVGANM